MLLALDCRDKWRKASAFPTSADTCCNVFTLLPWASCWPNPLYPPALHPGVREQTHRGDETLCSEGRERNATACVQSALCDSRVCCCVFCGCGPLWRLYCLYIPALHHTLFYLPLLCVCLSFAPPPLWGEYCLLYLQSGCPGFSVTFARSLFLWLVEIFNTRRLRAPHICLPAIWWAPISAHFFDSACSSAALYVHALCLCASAWGGSRPFICDCLCLRLYITPLLPVCRPSSKFRIFVQSAAFPLYLCVRLPVCVPVCARAAGSALFTMSVSARQTRDAMPQMFQSIGNKVRCHTMCGATNF